MKKLLELFRATLFSCVFLMTSITITFALFLLFWSPYSVRCSVARVYSYVNLFALKLICGLSFEVEGIENIPVGQSAIAMGNHQSIWETVICQLIFRPTIWVLKRELMWLPVFGWGLATLKPIAIKRGDGRKAVDQLLAQGKTVLDNMNCFIVIFPEGTRVAVHDEKKYKIGGALLAQKTHVPVIPFAHNAGYYWPKRGFIKRPGKIKLIIGKPIETQGKSAAAILRETELWIRQTQAEIKPNFDS